jgi:hypothetical protein
VNSIKAARTSRVVSRTGWLAISGLCTLVALTAAGCGRIGLNDPLIGGGTSQTNYEPLPAAPAAPVTTSMLPPPPMVTAPTVATGTPIDPLQSQQPAASTGAGIPIASANPPKPAEPIATDKAPAIGRGELAGGWRITSGADNCQLFITLTSWSGGYRASTKGCNSAEMQRISAWDISGKQVLLKSGDGAIVATLTGAGQEKFAGTTTSKQSVTLSR